MATVGALTFHEHNDETVSGTLYEDVEKTVVMNLTGASVEFIYKTSDVQDDVDAVIIMAIVTSPVEGEIEVNIPSELVDLNRRFFRIDVVAGSERKTAVYGPITVVNL